MRSSSTSRSKLSCSDGIRSSSERSGLISVNCLEREVDDRLPVGHGDLVERDRVAVAAGADLRDGVAAGGVARGAPVVGGDLADEAVQLDRPRRARAGRARAAAARRCSIARHSRCGRSPGGSRALRDLEPAAGQRVQQRRLAVARGRARAGRSGAGDQPVPVELGQAVDRRALALRRAARRGRSAPAARARRGRAARGSRSPRRRGAAGWPRPSSCSAGPTSLMRSRNASSRRLSGAGASCAPGAGRVPGARRRGGPGCRRAWAAAAAARSRRAPRAWAASAARRRVSAGRVRRGAARGRRAAVGSG